MTTLTRIEQRKLAIEHALFALVDDATIFAGDILDVLVAIRESIDVQIVAMQEEAKQ